MPDPRDTLPLNDTGSDVFSRFRYQAEISLSFCLNCALGSEISAVIPEYFEDIAIDCDISWRFIQVKSRNPERGLWKISDLLGPSGALRSLYRTYQQTETVKATLEIILEGAPKPGDPIENLKSGGNRENPELLLSVMNKLSIDENNAKSFLNRVTLHNPPPPRQNIKDRNIRLIHEQNPSLTHNEVIKIYNRLISEIERAMRTDPIGDEWPRYVIHPSQAPTEIEQRLSAKRLTRTYLHDLVKDLSSPPKHLLTRVIDLDSASISTLEEKLIIGGATEKIIERARILHANAQSRLLTLQAQMLYFRNDIIDDLNLRLETHVDTKCSLFQSSPRPAIDIWDSLLSEFTANAGAIDPNKIMKADPQLLLGQVCELAEICVVDWGKADAN
ncbi:MAG: dsDNA nuclease domain-containing protein [Promethearchaeota archaeon]